MATAFSHHHVPVHTDVIIVGNGPSAIALSFLLSGQQPYYSGAHITNEFLAGRLQAAAGTPITDQDLQRLSEGLEGRSTNPVALLFDALCHPNADLGGENPSVLSWEKDTKQAVGHVVLGKSLPGGAWQRMDGTLHTISQSSWMELPTLPFKDWLHRRHSQMQSSLGWKNGRATVAEVKSYYLDFVEWAQLKGNFRDNHMVTSIQKVFQRRTTSAVDSESGEMEPCCSNIKQNHAFLWEVRGHQMNEEGERSEFCYIAPHVVLATGAYDVSNRLCIPGESLPHVLHSLAEFELQVKSGAIGKDSDPVVVVGAGLSAADAILLALEAGIPVVHVFRVGPSDAGLVFRKLPASIYPEYHHIHSLMLAGEQPDGDLYHSFPYHCLVEICPDGKVLLQPAHLSSPSAAVIQSIDASLVVVMIGSRPDLSFLPHEGRHLGLVQDWFIDSKHNPIAIDPFTYQCQHECCLYAMGPLVGDNFVRFGVGGALGIASHLKKLFRKQH